MNFGSALEILMVGGLVARQGWNGKGMFIFMRPGDELSRDMVIKNVKSLPQSVKDYYGRMEQLDVEAGVPIEDEFGFSIQKVKFTPYLCMKAADGSIVNGWLASQTDLLAEDWVVVDPIEAANGSHAIANPPTA